MAPRELAGLGGSGGTRARVVMAAVAMTVLAATVTTGASLDSVTALAARVLPGAGAGGPAAEAGARSAVAAMPLSFIENQGQVDKSVAYYVQGSQTSLYFAPQGVTFALGSGTLEGTSARSAVALDFVGANVVTPTPTDPAPGVVSYFSGSPALSHTGLRTFGGLTYHDLWPGIDMTYTGTGAKLKYSFVVHPGADPAQIRLAYRGAAGVALDDGRINVSTPAGGFSDDKPFTYQDIGGRRVEVPSSYVLQPGSEAGSASFGIPVGAYDHSRELVVDPTVLVYAGFIGGDSQDAGFGIDVDSAGNAYVTGWARDYLATFPAVVGPDLTANGDFDAFVAKINPAGTAFVYVGFIGGSGTDYGDDITVDGDGNAYVAGDTASANFPATAGPDLTYNGAYDAFVAKVNPAGTGLVYAGYLGSDVNDNVHGIAVDNSGHAYVAGGTYSTNGSFPVVVGPGLTVSGYGANAFVAKLTADGTGLDYSGYVGGTGGDTANDIAVDTAGNAYITGTTSSSEASFPVLGGPDLTYAGGYNDAFVAKVNPAGTGLVYAGYIGGSDCAAGGDVVGCGTDRGNGIAVDGAGNAYVVGETSSTQATLPVVGGPDLTFNGYSDAFVAKVDPAGAGFVYLGYIGGGSTDPAEGVDVDSSGNAYVVGWTSSRPRTSRHPNGFPVTEGPDLTYNGGFDGDAFVAEVNAAGSGLVYAGYVGGSGDERGESIAVDPTGDAYITGHTDSSRLGTGKFTKGPDRTQDGISDAFVAKVHHTI